MLFASQIEMSLWYHYDYFSSMIIPEKYNYEYQVDTVQYDL